MGSLWGEEFSLPTKTSTKKLVEKVKKPKQIKPVSAEKTVKSKTVSIEEKLRVITENVYRILGKYAENTVVIRSYEDLAAYIDAAIVNGVIAIDTETNNSLDPVTCKIMGLCLYTPGLKNAYVPVNHINRFTGELLPNLVTEQQIQELLQRLVEAQIDVITHNGKFDYSVLKCTTGFVMPIYWDTLLGCKLLDENELSAKLKDQYIQKIDASIEKYDIEHLFEGIEYAIVDPEVFALYAATDSYMTYKLYLWQKYKMKQPDNSRVLNLATDIEMPLIPVLAEMQLNGMSVDLEYAKRLSKKYHKQLDEIDADIENVMNQLQPRIDAWRATDEANYHPPKKKGDGEAKSKSEQLTQPINLASPTQLAILFYDILKCPQVSKKSPRGTGEAELKAINEKLKLPICDLILKRREVVKLVTTYIDTIPELAKRWPDGRVRTHFNQYGAATGRLSSSDPLNFQNIPSHNKEIRMLFTAQVKDHFIESDNNCFVIPETDEVETTCGWKKVNELKSGDLLFEDIYIKSITYNNNKTFTICI